jgi:hypothetical protein
LLNTISQNLSPDFLFTSFRQNLPHSFFYRSDRVGAGLAKKPDESASAACQHLIVLWKLIIPVDTFAIRCWPIFGCIFDTFLAGLPRQGTPEIFCQPCAYPVGIIPIINSGASFAFMAVIKPMLNPLQTFINKNTFL